MSIPEPSDREKSERSDDTGLRRVVLDQMNSEYAILQDKIDKIGAFRFTIRGWSVTLVVASIVAAGSSRLVSPFILLLLLLFIYALYAVERKQNELGRRFGERALHIERRLKDELRLYTEGDPLVGFYPGIAHHLHNADSGRPVRSLWAWAIDPDRFFYLIQLVAVGLAIAILVHLNPSTRSDSAKDQMIIQIQASPSAAEVDNNDGAIPGDTKKKEQKSAEEKRH